MTKQFLKGAGILTVGNLITNFLNFLFYLIGKKLNPEEFGIIVTILSAYLVFSIPQAALKTYQTRLTAKKKTQNLKTLIISTLSHTMVLAITYIVIFLPSIGLLKTYLKLENILSLICLLIILLLDFPIQLFVGTFTGLKEFVKASICQISLIFFKLCFGLTAVFLFNNYIYILVGLALSSGLGLALCLFFTIKLLKKVEKRSKAGPTFKAFLGQILNLSLLSAGITILGNIDQLIVSNKLSADQAGQFAVLKTFGKFILFTNAGIVTAIIPFVAGDKGNSKKYLMLSLSLFLVISFVLILIYSLAPDFLVNLAFSSKYQSISSLLSFYGIAISLYTLIFLITNYLTSLNKNKVSTINFAISIMFLLILNASDFSSIFNFVTFEIFLYLIALIINLLYLIITKLDKQSILRNLVRLRSFRYFLVHLL